MEHTIYLWLLANKIAYADIIAVVLATLGIAFSCVVIYFIEHIFFHRFLNNKCANSSFPFLRSLSQTNFFTYAKLLLIGFLLKKLVDLWLTSSMFTAVLYGVAEIWIVLNFLLLTFALLNAFSAWSRTKPAVAKFPVRGIIQAAKLVLSIIVGIIIISLLIGKSPMFLLSGLGAMTAVLMLVFKDPILGLVAGIQLSANDMLKIGDWLEMNQHGADGEVIDIGLTTVKVRNWDSTTTTLPTYALISNSFRNWQSMVGSGARRVKRSITIDVNSIRFITQDDITTLAAKHILSGEMLAKLQEMVHQGGNVAHEGNQQGLTNIGVFRAYLIAYLQNHPNIRQDLTVMARQLAPASNGIPLELYCFINDVRWVFYEGIQADIFDHIYAVIGEFGLRIHQVPAGLDIQSLSKKG